MVSGINNFFIFFFFFFFILFFVFFFFFFLYFFFFFFFFFFLWFFFLKKKKATIKYYGGSAYKFNEARTIFSAKPCCGTLSCGKLIRLHRIYWLRSNKILRIAINTSSVSLYLTIVFEYIFKSAGINFYSY